MQFWLNPLTSLSDNPPVSSIKQAIVFVADKYGVEGTDYSTLEAVIARESGFDNKKVGKAGEIGLAQFMPSTWALWNKQRGTNLDIHSVKDQVDMMDWAFNKGYQNQWTCFRRLNKK